MRVFVLFFCALFLLGGCQPPQERRPVEVVIEGDGPFPQFLVGKWKAEGKSGLEINFTDDGTISSTVISMGRIRVTPGEITTAPMKMGKKSVIEPGPWLVRYNPTDRDLIVNIVLKHIYMELGNTILDGDITDVFIGTVSEDGDSWRVIWTTYTNLIGHIPGQGDFDFSADPNYGFSTELVFKKITE